MKPAVLAIIGAPAAAAVIAAIIAFSYPMNSQKAIETHVSGDFTAYIIEDSSRRLLAQLENRGPLIEDAGAFLVRQGFNSECEPQGVVVSNFNVVTRGS